MAIWSAEEDKLLSDTILDYLGRGASVMDAIVKTAKKLNRPIESCSGRWYDHLQEKFKDAVESIRTNVKRINEYVGGWNNRENQKFIDLMVQLQVSDLGVKESILKCSQTFGRSLSSCNSQWYNYILPRNKLTITNMIAEGKENMVQAKTTNLSRTWAKDEENIALSIVLSSLKNGNSVKSAFDVIAQRLRKGVGTVRTYWYEFIFPENEKTVNEVRGKVTVNTSTNTFWNDDNKLELYTIISNEVESGTGKTKAIELAAVKFGRPTNEVHNIWYNHARNNNVLKELYEKNKGAVTVVKEETPTIVVGRGDFSDFEDTTIADSVIAAAKEGKSIAVAFQEVAEFLTRPFSEIELRWRKVLQYRYANALINARNSRKETPKEVKQVITPAQEHKVVLEQPTSGLDLDKMTQFMGMIQDLINKNGELELQVKQLQNDNASLKDRLSKTEELEIQNKQLVAAMERAKQFLNFDIQAATQAN
jgi:RsfA family transcription factor